MNKVYAEKKLAFFLAFPPPAPAGFADLAGFLESLASFLGG